MSNNLTKHNFSISRSDREKISGHSGIVLWFTGLSASGKSTIANALDIKLNKLGFRTYILDGDNIRMGLNRDLGFSNLCRKENIRRISEVAKLFVDSGTIVMTAFISPYLEDRKSARNLLGKDFVEIFVNTPVEVCINRDPKGLYKKAFAGELENFTKINDPYEKPLNPEIHLKNLSVNHSVKIIMDYLKKIDIVK